MEKVEQLNAKAADCATEAIATDNSYFAGYVMRGRVLGQRGNILGAMNDFRIANECANREGMLAGGACISLEPWSMGGKSY